MTGRAACALRGFPAGWREHDLAGWELEHGRFHEWAALGVPVAKGRGGRHDALNEAARFYKREAGWDFAPCDWPGPKAIMVRSGRLVGFALAATIAQPTGEYPWPGTYLEHLWVARSRRRHGIATLCCARLATAHGPLFVLGPFTGAGSAWARSAKRAGLVVRARAKACEGGSA